VGEQSGLRGRARVLYAAPFVTTFDRFSIAPLLVPIAQDLHVSLGAVTAVATAYYVLYGGMQLVYGLLSDRLGRIRLMRVTCLATCVTGVVSALAPNLPVLIVGRALTGSLICAILPTSLVYVGDRFPFRVRQSVIATLMAAVAVGTTAATLGAGLIAHYGSWRIVFLLPALAALVLAATLGWVPESVPGSSAIGTLELLRGLARQRWLVFLCLVAVLEGAAMLGNLTFLAPALEAHGVNPAVAGAVAAAYGVAVLGGTQLVRRLRLAPHLLLAGGGLLLIAGYLAAATDQHIPGILVASLLAGLAYATMHSTFQAWATETVPEARGTATAMFVTAAFLGAGIGTSVLAPLTQSGRWGLLFLLAAAASVPVVVLGSVGRRRFAEARGA
jgi:predicted MFS family arabinose efflux permease